MDDGVNEALLDRSLVHREPVEDRLCFLFSFGRGSDGRALAGVLTRNTHVDKLVIHFHGQGIREWRSFLGAIRTREGLRTVEIGAWVSGTSLGPLLDAVGDNASVESVDIGDFLLSGAPIASFVNGRSLKELSLHSTSFSNIDRDQAIVCSAFQNNDTLKSLSLKLLPEGCIENILDALANSSCTAVEGLTLLPPDAKSTRFSNSLKRFVESTASLRRICFDGGNRFHNIDFDKRSFQPIAETLCAARNLLEFSFKGCCFEDNESRDAMKSLLQRKGIRKIEIADPFDHLNGLEFSAADTAALLQPSLRSIALSSELREDLFFSEPKTLSAFFEQLGSSALQDLSIGMFLSMDSADFLVRNIPNFQNLRRLTVGISQYLSDWSEDGVFMASFVDSVRKNGSLRTVKLYFSDGYEMGVYGDDRERQMLRYCGERNKGMDTWIESSAVLPQSIWPMAIEKAFETGYGTVFQALVSISSHFPSSPHGRKRKRPKYFVP